MKYDTVRHYFYRAVDGEYIEELPSELRLRVLRTDVEARFDFNSGDTLTFFHYVEVKE